MNTILQYIKNGKGFGFVFILAVAVLMVIPQVFNLKKAYNEAQPKIMLVAEDFLPITVKNSKIIEPVGVYKRIDLAFDSEEKTFQSFPVVLNTKDDKFDATDEKFGLFIMSDMVYLISQNKIQKFELKDGLIDKTKFGEMLETASGVFSVVYSIVFILTFFVFAVVKVLLAVLFGNIFLRIQKRRDEYNFPLLMRLCSMLIAFISLLLNVFFPVINGFIALFLIIIGEILFLLNVDIKQKD